MRLPATFIAIAAVLRVDGQATIRFVGPANQWYVADTYPQGSIDNPNFIRTTTLHYFLSGDSLIAGNSWGRIFVQGTTEPSSPQEFQGLVRQEGDVVLFLDDQGGIDTLYDFRLAVGDSMRYTSPFYDTHLPLVAVDSTLIQGTYHKVLRFGEYPLSLGDLLSDTWIEGIGSIHGPLAPRLPNTLGYNYAIPDSTRTTCFLQDEQVLWSHHGYPECVANAPVDLPEQLSGPAFTLHPNPGATFQLTGIGHRPALLRMLDIQGRVVSEGIATTAHAPADMAEMKPGTYLVEVRLADGKREMIRWVKE